MSYIQIPVFTINLSLSLVTCRASNQRFNAEIVQQLISSKIRIYLARLYTWVKFSDLKIWFRHVSDFKEIFSLIYRLFFFKKYFFISNWFTEWYCQVLLTLMCEIMNLMTKLMLIIFSAYFWLWNVVYLLKQSILFRIGMQIYKKIKNIKNIPRICNETGFFTIINNNLILFLMQFEITSTHSNQSIKLYIRKKKKKLFINNSSVYFFFSKPAKNIFNDVNCVLK